METSLATQRMDTSKFNPGSEENRDQITAMGEMCLNPSNLTHSAVFVTTTEPKIPNHQVHCSKQT